MALQPGDSRRVLFYTRDSSGALTDAATLHMYLRNALGVWTTYNYPTTLLTKIDTGTYQLIVYIPNAATSTGQWKYEGEALDGSGNPLTVSVGGFEVGVSERLGTA